MVHMEMNSGRCVTTWSKNEGLQILKIFSAGEIVSWGLKICQMDFLMSMLMLIFMAI